VRMNIRSGGPHHGQPVLVDGPAPGQGDGVLIMLHGRGASAESLLELARLVATPTTTLLLPQAAGHAWYPNRFMAPIESNEPWLSSALEAVGDLVDRVTVGAGLAASRLVLGGFSQGACLALEFAVRQPAAYGGVAALSGGLIGPAGTVWSSPGRLDGVPVFLGCSDVDDHIPVERVHESTAVLKELGANVLEAIYPGMGHTVNVDEMRQVQALIAQAR
jgi:phospholipase/carboxylesterase